MYCTNCGAQNPDGSSFCQKCGAALGTAAAPTPVIQPVAIARKTSGMAVASLVLGILGFMTGITAVLAIIFGAVALGQIAKDPGLDGKGMAIAGLVMGIVVVVGWLLVFLFVFALTATAFNVESTAAVWIAAFRT
jgi:hypothetical protein